MQFVHPLGLGAFLTGDTRQKLNCLANGAKQSNEYNFYDKRQSKPRTY
jgi:hypothetical protein